MTLLILGLIGSINSYGYTTYTFGIFDSGQTYFASSNVWVKNNLVAFGQYNPSFNTYSVLSQNDLKATEETANDFRNAVSNLPGTGLNVYILRDSEPKIGPSTAKFFFSGSLQPDPSKGATRSCPAVITQDGNGNWWTGVKINSEKFSDKCTIEGMGNRTCCNISCDSNLELKVCSAENDKIYFKY